MFLFFRSGEVKSANFAVLVYFLILGFRKVFFGDLASAGRCGLDESRDRNKSRAWVSVAQVLTGVFKIVRY